MKIQSSKRLAIGVALALSTVVLAACDRGPAPAAKPSVTTTSDEWPKFVDRFIEDYFVANPATAVMLGRHEFDGQLPDWSAAGIQRAIARLEEERARVVEFTDAKLTSSQERFQRDYLLSRIDNDLFWYRDAKQPSSNPVFYLNYGLDPSTYVTVPYAPADQRLRAFIKYARGVPNAAEQIQANLTGPLPKTFIDFGVSSFGGLADFFRGDAIAAFAQVKDEQLQKELKAAIEPAAEAMARLAKMLEGQAPKATDAYALGAERFALMVKMTENVTTPLAKIEAVGATDLERNLAALRAACAQYLPNASVEQCVQKQSADKPEGGAVVGARNQLAQLRQFVVEHDIVSIPGTETALVEQAPAFKSQNFAYINIPGPYEKNLPSVYYIAPPDPKWSKAEQDAYVPGKADLLFTSVHEVWPGHFLQFLHSNRSPWRFGQLFVGYAFAEGWAHYTEEMMIEEGIAKGAPELQVGQLLNALLRNVRYMCAIGLHTQGMSVAQCEQMFKEKAYQDAGNARQQAARGTYDPAYLNYTMGKLMIMKLREDWLAANPGGTRKQFHDQLLSFGGPPIPLARAQMIKGPAGELF
ncbi:MAG TPA: DUF885 domain-containing protein [Steroidobacteraceae bacterium]|nr:DUF885 domain-containing protein [Steroidobacteraceae bacterium]